MKKNSLLIPIFLIIVFTGLSCNTTYQSQTLQYSAYRINDKQQKDSSLLAFLEPYSTTVHSTMNNVIGIAEITLEKRRPECTLGNFLTDAFITMAKEKYSTPIDAAFMNYGGIRVEQLPKGNVTTGKIFEVMPFDNLLIIQKLKGDILQQFLDLTAEDGGWPVAGINMQIKNDPSGQAGKKAVNVMIGGKPIDLNATYTIVNSDFIANGGSNADMLRKIPQISNGYLMRDAIFDYIKLLKSQDRNISAKIENRVTEAN
jgi:2',3'-cyclic-nucleotide 2'-phosphodiesterase (5'-nucleotidase family)